MPSDRCGRALPSTVIIGLFVTFCVLTVRELSSNDSLFRLYLIQDAHRNMLAGSRLSFIEPLPSASVKPLCSFALFRKVANSQEDGYVNGSGSWTRQGSEPVRFYPSLCRFRHATDIPRAEILQCIRQQKLQYIVLSGDSNSMRYYAALGRILTSAGATCTTIQGDGAGGRTVHKGYYTFNRPNVGPLLVHDRDCAGCSNEKMRCEMKTENITVIVERLVMEFTIDAEVTSFQSYLECGRQRQQFEQNIKNITRPTFHLCRASTTTQQFILKEYFASTPPDLLVVFGNSHDSFRYTLHEHAMNVRTFADMADVYLPASTRFIWTSKPAEYLPIKPGMFREKLYESGTMDITQWLVLANRAHYRELRGRFVSNKTPLMFMDLRTIGESVQRDWNLDGVHMKPVWYQHIISFLFQSLCPFKESF